MSLDHAILGFLNVEDLSGYDLKTRCFDDRARHFWTADQAQVYRTLERLHDKRLVTLRTVRQSRKPDRKVYAITDNGRRELADWIVSKPHLPPARDPFLLRLEFSGDLNDETVLDVIARERSAHQDRLDDLRARVSTLGSGSCEATERTCLVHRMTLDGAIARTRATIDWLDDCSETISAHMAQAPPQRTLFESRTPKGDTR